MFTSTITAALVLAAGVLGAPAPTRTTGDIPSRAIKLTGVTHSIAAGRQLTFQADNVFANAGDIIEWHFAPQNHSVVQSSFEEPCKPLAGGFHSGFNFATKDGQSQADNVFQLVIEDASKTLWYYCGQPGGGGHCQKGMVGVINQQQLNPPKLDAYRKAAALTGVSVNPPDSPYGSAGGKVMNNPNPLAGF
jgi:plastocyanin